MADAQETLVNAFGDFGRILSEMEGGPPDVHIGVISSDLGTGTHRIGGCSAQGDRAQFLVGTNCPALSNNFVVDTSLRDGTRITNYEDTLTNTLQCMGAVGVSSCEITQPLEAMRTALDPTNDNGFVRKDAFLMVVFIAASDDCSASDAALFDPDRIDLGPATAFRCFEHGIECDPDNPREAGTKQQCEPRPSALLGRVDDYAAFLHGLKPDPSLVFVAATFGAEGPIVVSDDNATPQLTPSCTSTAVSATPALRLQRFLDSFPQRSTAKNICSEPIHEVLEAVTSPLRSSTTSPCIDGDIDLSREAVGIQHECVVTETEVRDGIRVTHPVPECESTSNDTRPCWRLETDASCSHTETGLALTLEREAIPWPQSSVLELRCHAGCEAPSSR